MTRLTFCFMLLRRAYTVTEFEQLLAGVGFARAEIQTNAIGMEIWVTS